MRWKQARLSLWLSFGALYWQAEQGAKAMELLDESSTFKSMNFAYSSTTRQTRQRQLHVSRYHVHDKNNSNVIPVYYVATMSSKKRQKMKGSKMKSMMNKGKSASNGTSQTHKKNRVKTYSHENTHYDPPTTEQTQGKGTKGQTIGKKVQAKGRGKGIFDRKEGTRVPTRSPVPPPTNVPTMLPTRSLTPTRVPTPLVNVTTSAPTPSMTFLPVTEAPTTTPTLTPTLTTIVPTAVPNIQPTNLPTAVPNAIPTTTPTILPTTATPSTLPTSASPTSVPTFIAINSTLVPSITPTASISPSIVPSSATRDSIAPSPTEQGNGLFWIPNSGFNITFFTNRTEFTTQEQFDELVTISLGYLGQHMRGVFNTNVDYAYVGQRYRVRGTYFQFQSGVPLWHTYEGLFRDTRPLPTPQDLDRLIEPAFTEPAAVEAYIERIRTELPPENPFSETYEISYELFDETFTNESVVDRAKHPLHSREDIDDYFENDDDDATNNQPSPSHKLNDQRSVNLILVTLAFVSFVFVLVVVWVLRIRWTKHSNNLANGKDSDGVVVMLASSSHHENKYDILSSSSHHENKYDTLSSGSAESNTDWTWN